MSRYSKRYDPLVFVIFWKGLNRNTAQFMMLLIFISSKMSSPKSTKILSCVLQSMLKKRMQSSVSVSYSKCPRFFLDVRVPQQWTWQILETTLCWSFRWEGLSLEEWSTSPIRSTYWSRWSRRSRREKGGGGLSRWGHLCDIFCFAVPSFDLWKANSFIFCCLSTGDP